MKLTLILLLLFTCSTFFTANAQHTYTITFNEAGQITSELPSLLTTGDKIKFVVMGTPDAYEARVLQAYTLYLETIKNLDKNDDGKYKVLLEADLNEPDYRRLLYGVQAKMAKALLDWISDTKIKQLLEKKRNITEDKYKLNSYLTPERVNLRDLTSLVIPDLKKMTIPDYVIEYSFSNLSNPEKIECKEPKVLTPDEKKCLWIFNSSDIELPSADSAFFRLSFKLRIRNNLYSALNEQLKAISSLVTKVREIDVDAQKKTLQDNIKVLRKQAPANDMLFNWMDSRLNGKEDKKDLASLQTTFNNKPAATSIINALETFDVNLFKTSLKDTATVKLMLLLSWVNKGTALTMNPLTNGLPTDNKGIIAAKTEELADSTLSLAVVTKKIDLYESMLKPSGQNGYRTPNYQEQLKSYNALLDLQKTINKKLPKLIKEIADLKDQQTKNNKNQTDYKKSILSDSLLYSGFLNVSLFKNNVNHPGYHYMRHHDELNDYRHFDNKLQKEINEKQFLEVIIDNHDPKSKMVVKFTFTDAGADVDFLGAQLPGSVNSPTPGDKGKFSANTLEDIFKVYNRIQTLFIPYRNGIIALPLTPISDATADYISKTNVTPDADKLPAKGSYTFLDSLTAKNLTSHTTSFAFRVNKLYRFRLKAGIAYSTLERKSYTINSTTNTASYTTSYAGLAPTFGIQIFTAPIDIQRADLFPTGGSPFFYVGYMFSDAPVNNFLLGGGIEVLSGFAITIGCHLGKSQKLFNNQGSLQTKDRYTAGYFVSASFGLEAFKAIFNSAKTISNPFTK